MLNFIYAIPLIGKIVKQQVAACMQKAVHSALKQKDSDKKEDYAKIQSFKWEQLSEGLVISVGNEWQDLLIGKIVGFMDKDGNIPLIQDICTGETFGSFGIIFPYNDKLLEAMCKLDPFERYSIACGNNSYYSAYVFDKNKSVMGRPPVELKDFKFFKDKVDSYLANQ